MTPRQVNEQFLAIANASVDKVVQARVMYPAAYVNQVILPVHEKAMSDLLAWRNRELRKVSAFSADPRKTAYQLQVKSLETQYKQTVRNLETQQKAAKKAKNTALLNQLKAQESAAKSQYKQSVAAAKAAYKAPATSIAPSPVTQPPTPITALPPTTPAQNTGSPSLIQFTISNPMNPAPSQYAPPAYPASYGPAYQPYPELDNFWGDDFFGDLWGTPSYDATYLWGSDALPGSDYQQSGVEGETFRDPQLGVVLVHNGEGWIPDQSGKYWPTGRKVKISGGRMWLQPLLQGSGSNVVDLPTHGGLEYGDRLYDPNAYLTGDIHGYVEPTYQPFDDPWSFGAAGIMGFRSKGGGFGCDPFADGCPMISGNRSIRKLNSAPSVPRGSYGFAQWSQIASAVIQAGATVGAAALQPKKQASGSTGSQLSVADQIALAQARSQPATSSTGQTLAIGGLVIGGIALLAVTMGRKR